MPLLEALNSPRNAPLVPTESAALIAAPHAGGWLYTGALENYPRLVDAWAELRPLLGNRGDILRRVRNPQLMAEVFARAGRPCPEVTFDAASEARRVSGPMAPWR